MEKLIIEKKIVVCHVVNSLGIGGMENGIVNLANNHDRDKFEIIICCLNKAGEMATRLNDDLRLVVLNGGNGFSFLRVLKVLRIFKKIKPDIVHTHGWGGGSFYGIVGAKLAGIPVIINGEHGTFFKKKTQIIAQRILFLQCTLNMAVSEILKKRVAKFLKIPDQKTIVIKNGVDTKKFSGNYPKEKIFKRLCDDGYDVDVTSFNIFIIGSLKPVKALNIVLMALEKIKKEIKNYKLRTFFIGDGPLRCTLKEYANRVGIGDSTYFLGKRSDIHELLSVAHVLVSTSISEGLSNVILEAMASGVPVIATKTGSEEIVIDGKNGFLIPEGGYNELAQYLHKLVTNREELERLSMNAREFVLSAYSIDRMINNYEKVYFDLLKY